MTALLDTTDHQPRSRAVHDKDADFSPKAMKAAELSSAMDLFMKLSPEGKKAALAVARWLIEDRRPETDPRKLDPYWQDFPDCLAVKVSGKAS